MYGLVYILIPTRTYLESYLANGCEEVIDILRPLKDKFFMQSWVRFTPQTCHGIYYSPTYLIPQFLPESTMINTLLLTSVLCCETRINPHWKLSRDVMQPFWTWSTYTRANVIIVIIHGNLKGNRCGKWLQTIATPLTPCVEPPS